MKYKAEIFDKYFFLYDKTGFSDHQVHCVIYFNNHLNVYILKKAAALLMKTIPILSRVYKDYGGDSYWEDAGFSESDLLAIVNSEDDFYRFTVSRTNEAAGPQLRICLLEQPGGDALSLILNHMVCDATGMKQCVYLLSGIYTNLMKDPDYKPNCVIDGDRGFKKILRAVNLLTKIKILRSEIEDTSTEYEFPFNKQECKTPFIAVSEIKPDVYKKIRSLCDGAHVTVNDVILTAFFRVISGLPDINGKELTVPMTADMRRYLKDKDFHALSNLTSNIVLKMIVMPEENFKQTLKKINTEMNIKKAGYPGMSVFLRLDLLFKIYPKNIYSMIENTPGSPKIGMTNAGIIDAEKLNFLDSVVLNAVICGSIKYRPYFQMCVSTFRDKMTLSVNLYGDEDDRDAVEGFFRLMEYELGSLE